MAELFELLLKLKCTDIRLSLTDCSVTFWRGAQGAKLTVSAPDTELLVKELKPFLETAE